MQNRSLRSFALAFGLTLLIFLPMILFTELWQRHLYRQERLVSQSQSGVAIRLPKTENDQRFLLCIGGDTPGFLLLDLNAPENCIRLMALPAETLLPFGGGEATLAACYTSAGPARCAQGLTEVLGVEVGRYLALSPKTLVTLGKGFEPFRLSLTGVLTEQELARRGLGSGVQDWSAAALAEILAQKGTLLSPAQRCGLEAAVWDAFFRQRLEKLPSALPAALRRVSSSLLTDLPAGELLLLGETLEFLADGDAPVESSVLPGEWDEAAGNYRLNEASLAAAQALYSAAPTDSQRESAKAP